MITRMEPLKDLQLNGRDAPLKIPLLPTEEDTAITKRLYEAEKEGGGRMLMPTLSEGEIKRTSSRQDCSRLSQRPVWDLTLACISKMDWITHTLAKENYM